LSFVPAFQPDPARFSDDDFRAVLKFGLDHKVAKC
jgi:hypothetical protein